MFYKNLKELRKSKGFTQEELASKINVVRQTVSKWEKGLSVPDADSLQQIAEVLEVEVSQLLGAKIETAENNNEIAEQLARINEQLVIKNRSSRKRWRLLLIIFLVPLVMIIVMSICAHFLFTNTKQSGSEVIEEIEYEEFEDTGLPE